MNPKLRQFVHERAGDRCEYCLMRLHTSARPFHAEHIIAQQHQGSDEKGNLALACQNCNLLKGPNLTSIDPDTSLLTRLFHPRQDVWEDHFRIDGPRICGLTDIGRTTVWLLEMNDEDRVALRVALQEAGEWP